MPEFIAIDAAAALIGDETTLALGGMTIYRRPVAFIYALLRRPKRPHNLTLLAFTAGYECDLLVGAGCVRDVRTVYFGLESFGFAPMYTQAAQKGLIQTIEETEASLSMGMRARMSGAGFMPSRAWIGTDLPRLRPDVKQIEDPYTGEMLMAFPAIGCDVAVLHAVETDLTGNVKLNNNLGVDLELIYISDLVIVTTDRIVDHVQRDSEGFIVPAQGIDYVVHVPNGAHPTAATRPTPARAARTCLTSQPATRELRQLPYFGHQQPINIPQLAIVTVTTVD